MKLDIRHCEKNGRYYLQCVMEDRSLARRIDEMNRLMTKASPGDREDHRLCLAELRRQRGYMTDYIPLEEREVPPGVRVRKLPFVPKKIVSVDRETKRWLLAKFYTGEDGRQTTGWGGVHCYDLPAEDGEKAHP